MHITTFYGGVTVSSITARDANRHFSSLLRDVASGKSVTVLSHGKPVATISPVKLDEKERESAKVNLLDRLRLQQPVGMRDWTREELYEADE